MEMKKFEGYSAFRVVSSRLHCALYDVGELFSFASRVSAAIHMRIIYPCQKRGAAPANFCDERGMT